MIKKIVTGLGIAGLLCLVPLSVNYICNMRFIRNYDKGIYKSSEVNQVLGFFSRIYIIIIMEMFITMRKITRALRRSTGPHLDTSRVVKETV